METGSSAINRWRPTFTSLEWTAAVLGYDDGAGVGRARRLVHRLDRLSLVEITVDPGFDHVTHVHRIALAAEQVIGASQRDEAFRMFGRRENAVGVVDSDGLIQGRVENE